MNGTGQQPQHETTQSSTAESTFPEADKKSSLKDENVLVLLQPVHLKSILQAFYNIQNRSIIMKITFPFFNSKYT